MGYNTWNDVGGEFCSYTSGVEIGIVGMLRKILVTLYEVMSTLDEWKSDKMDNLDLWLHLPTGHEIRLTSERGELVRFDTWIQKIEYGACEYNFGVYQVVCLLPKKHYASYLDAIAAPLDHYIELGSENIRRVTDEDEDDINVWGVISDTAAVIQWLALITFFLTTLRGFGMIKVALKFAVKFFKWFKTRAMRQDIGTILDTVEQINDYTESELELLEQHLSKLVVRKTFT